jgi:hypothetical protein
VKHVNENWLILLEYDHGDSKVALQPVDFAVELWRHICHAYPLFALAEELDQAKTQFLLLYVLFCSMHSPCLNTTP